MRRHQIVTNPDYSMQHRGFSPKGPQDRTSYRIANEALGNRICQSLEIFSFPFSYKIASSSLFIVTGAVAEIYLNKQNISRNKVYVVEKDSELYIEPPIIGNRCYLTFGGAVVSGKKCIHQEWPWRKRIKVLKGPEYDCLTKLSQFHMIKKISDMGIVLEGETTGKYYDIISSPVVDGTIQLTPSGPIVLMRGRQTIGGYPRILNVIEEDLDYLSQLRPRTRIEFEVQDEVHIS